MEDSIINPSLAESDDTIDSFLRAVAGVASEPVGREPPRLATELMVLRTGMLIGERFRLDRALAAGGMGVVWSATHVITRRAVALKFLKYTLQLNPGARQRFFREARAASAVLHPNVVEVIDVLELDGAPVIVMPLLQGETLAERLGRACRGQLSVAQTAHLMLPVISAVQALHASGIVHRDLKPQNIFIDGRYGVKVLDFGVAKLARSVEEHGVRTTEDGVLLGTPCYMSLEQALGEPDIDSRTDVWAIGVILYECLSGKRPVHGSSAGHVVLQLMGSGIEPLAQLVPELPSDLAACVTEMLTCDRAIRPRELRKIETLLGRYTAVASAPRTEVGGSALRSRTAERPPWLLGWGTGLALVTLVSVGVWFLFPEVSRNAHAVARAAAALVWATRPTASPALREPHPHPIVRATGGADALPPLPAISSASASPTSGVDVRPPVTREESPHLLPVPRAKAPVYKARSEPRRAQLGMPHAEPSRAQAPFQGGLVERAPF